MNCVTLYWSDQPICWGILPCGSLYGYGQWPLAFWPSSSYYVTPLGGYMALSAHLMAINAQLWPSNYNSKENLRVGLWYGHNNQSHWFPHDELSCFLLPINTQRQSLGFFFFFFLSFGFLIFFSIKDSETLHLLLSTKGFLARDSWAPLTLPYCQAHHSYNHHHALYSQSQ